MKPPIRLEQTQEQPSAKERLLALIAHAGGERTDLALLALEAAAEIADHFAVIDRQDTADCGSPVMYSAELTAERIRALADEIRGQR